MDAERELSVRGKSSAVHLLLNQSAVIFMCVSVSLYRNSMCALQQSTVASASKLSWYKGRPVIMAERSRENFHYSKCENCSDAVKVFLFDHTRHDVLFVEALSLLSCRESCTSASTVHASSIQPV